MPDITALNAAIDAYAQQAHGSDADGGELQNERALALDAYAGKNIEPAPEGRSQVVDWSIFETVQWILPSLTRIFAGGDSIVEFEPTGPEDEDASKQESEYLNYLVTQKNNWFMVILQWFTDALITKNAYCYAYMEKKLVPEKEKYEDISEEQVAMLLEDDVEVIGQEAYEDADNPQQVQDPFTGQVIEVPTIKYNIEIRKTKPVERLRFKVLPPERTLVGEDTTDFTLDCANYFEYWDLTTISDLRKEGYDVPDDIADDPYSETLEDYSRDERWDSDLDIDTPDKSMRQVVVRHIWIRHDYDEDGIAELQYVVRVGHEVLHREEVSSIPVASIVPFINTHRHIGVSVADLVFDIQRIKTALLRGGLDSLNLSINPRHVITDQVTLDDMMVSRSGALIRLRHGAVNPQSHVMPLPTENVFPQAQEGLRHMDSVIESRVGVNRVFQGIDQSMMQDNSYNAVGQLSTMASQRVEQIARVFANGVERLFAIAHELIIKSGHQNQAIRLRGQWVNIDPTQWRTGRDMRIVAPFAAGNKDSLLQRLMMIAQIHEKALAGGLPIVDANDAYNLALEISSAADVPGDRFFTDPATIPPKEPPPDYTAIALSIEDKKANNEAADEERQAQIDAAKLELERDMEKYRADLQSATQIAIAQLKAGQAIDLERIRAELKEPDAPSDDQTVSEMLDRLAEIVQIASKPKRVLRDEEGNVLGIE